MGIPNPGKKWHLLHFPIEEGNPILLGKPSSVDLRSSAT